VSKHPDLKRQLNEDRARYVGMIQAACEVHDRFGPFGPLSRRFGVGRAYEAIIECAKELARQNMRTQQRLYRVEHGRREEDDS